MKNNFFGSLLLIAGSTIGAGMLALPIVVGQVGLFYGFLSYLFIWTYMLSSVLMLLECLSYESTPKNAVSAGKSNNALQQVVLNLLGPVGKNITVFLYLSLFGCLMIAYIDKGGSLLWSYVTNLSLMNKGLLEIHSNYGGQVLISLITVLILICRTKIVDWSNRIGMVVLIASFVLLVSSCIPFIETKNLTYQNSYPLIFILPFLITSFGFHNMLPSIVRYNGGFNKNTFWAVVLGSFTPLFVYALWTICVVGIIPVDGENGLTATLKAGRIATDVLSQKMESNFSFAANMLGTWAQAFAFSAIFTSLLGQGLSVADFILDGLKDRNTQLKKIIITVIFVTLCLIFALIEPNIFMAALEFAGGIFAILLFGLIPGIMVLKGRSMNQKAGYISPFSNSIIYVFLLIGASIFILEIMKATHVIHMGN